MLHSAKKKELWQNVYVIIPWVCAFVHFFLISFYSSQPANDSAQESRYIAEKIVGVIQNVPAQSAVTEDSLMMVFVHKLVRKCAHLLNFTILGFMYAVVFVNLNGSNLHRAYTVSGICGLFASIFDEVHQYFVPGRSAELLDVTLDSFGILIGICIFDVLLSVCIDKIEVKQRGVVAI